ncbi:arylesterase [Alcanivorax sp. HI0033]|uniref:arylesterase n=2 Tax=Alcanivorax TaxID=59753 RepID=UPI0007B93883|nr:MULTISPECIES: arylesterase [unclassified Alcanivorax]KZX73734.1 arylesterase [Alcanivorax sp. HI0013]KZX83732.1 arylesterase [Alcanivorax sp. HI0011]KZY16090.1 arylesterase [Alcanivorax sp. HI0035]KZX71333.1 arylesterase [Alcanivorax sp. HI0003]KZX72129.1 arylesterase [Alcanivorax sp. HI0007]
MIRLLVVTVLAMASLSVQAGGLLVLGDSISAAYGIEKSAGWVALLEKELEQRCRDFPVINASVSGETTAGGNSRLEALLDTHSPDIVIIELGGNDGLRGLSPVAMANNLTQMIEKSRAANATPVLLGMRIPPNYGQQYTRLFEQQFRQVSDDKQVPLFPFFLEGVVEQGWLQKDGIHPTEEAQPLLKRHAISVLEPVLPAQCGNGKGDEDV